MHLSHRGQQAIFRISASTPCRVSCATSSPTSRHSVTTTTSGGRVPPGSNSPGTASDRIRKASPFRRSKSTTARRADRRTPAFQNHRLRANTHNTPLPELLSRSTVEIQAWPDGRPADGGRSSVRQGHRSKPLPGPSRQWPSDIYRTDLLAKIADGEYAWEDSSSMTALPIKLAQDRAEDDSSRAARSRSIHSTHRSAIETGPINCPADMPRARFLIKWIAPILRTLAERRSVPPK